jgi:transposase-like protein
MVIWSWRVDEMSDEGSENIQRWTTTRKAALVVSIMKGETSVAEAARKHGLTVAEVEDWKDRFFMGAENALRSRPRDEEALKDEHIKKLKAKIGELVIDIDILKEAQKPYLPTGPGTWGE